MKKLLLIITMILVVSLVFSQVSKPVKEVSKPKKGWDGTIKNLFELNKNVENSEKMEITVEKNGVLNKKIEFELRKQFSVGKTKVLDVALDREEGIPYLVISATQAKIPVKIVCKIEPLSANKMLLTQKFMIRCHGKCAGNEYSGGPDYNCAIVSYGFKKWCNCNTGCMLEMRPVSFDLLAQAFFTFP